MSCNPHSGCHRCCSKGRGESGKCFGIMRTLKPKSGGLMCKNQIYITLCRYRLRQSPFSKRSSPLRLRQLPRNSAISRVRFVVERTFGSQHRWYGGKTLRYRGLAKAHAWHVLLTVAYNLKSLPRLYVESLLPCACHRQSTLNGRKTAASPMIVGFCKVLPISTLF